MNKMAVSLADKNKRHKKKKKYLESSVGLLVVTVDFEKHLQY